MTEDLDDVELIARVRGGDTAAFGQLWEAHAAAARRFASGLTRRFDPDDLVSEAYTQIFAALQAGKGPSGPFRPYLYVTIRNTAVSWARRDREDGLEDAESIPDPRATDAAILAAVDENLTLQAFRSLPERWQQVLWLTEVEAIAPQAIATQMGIRPNAVAALSYRAREGLRQAWIQAHIDSSHAGSEHRWTLENVGKWARNDLSPRNEVRMDRHLAECDKCSLIAAEAKATSSTFTTMLLPLAAGLTGTAGLGWSAFQSTTHGPADDAAANADAAKSEGTLRAAASVRRRRVLVTAAFVTLLVGGSGVAWSSAVGSRTPSSARESLPSASATSSTGAAPVAPARTAAPTSPPSSAATSAPPGAPGSRPTSSTSIDDGTDPDVGERPVPSASAARGASDPDGAGSTDAAPTITEVDTGGGAHYPVVSGTAAPGASVQLRARTGTLSVVTTGREGRWRSNSLDAFPIGTSQVTATTAGGSATSVVTVRQPTISTSFSGDSITVRITGIPGTRYQVSWDGAEIGAADTDGSGAATVSAAVSAAGTHTVSVRASAGARVGPSTSVTTRQ